MNIDKKEELIKKLDLILCEFDEFDKAKINSKGDIIIKNKLSSNKNKQNLFLADIFKQIIANDIKKNRV